MTNEDSILLSQDGIAQPAWTITSIFLVQSPALASLRKCDCGAPRALVAKGNGWAAASGLPPVRLSAGDIVMFAQGDRHVISSAPGLEPIPASAEWVAARRDEPKPAPIAFHPGIREPGVLTPVADADAVLVCGFLGCDLRPCNPLVAALSRILHLPAARAGGWVARVIDQAVVESNEQTRGGDAVLERLSEMMFVDAARHYLDSVLEDATGWLAGLRDRFVGKALALMHERPDHPWSVDNLAREVGYESKAAFSRAFKHKVGMPPAAWRKAQASGQYGSCDVMAQHLKARHNARSRDL